MKKEENLKQLKMVLTKHKPIMLDLRDNQVLLLKWDEEEQNYRGYYEKLGMEVGIWDLEWLFQIAIGNTKYRLVLIDE